jgi:S1-C subfamily serine protease
VSVVYERVANTVAVIETIQQEVSTTELGALTTMEGLGSGVLISDSGLVLTAAHVVQTADAIIVHFTTDAGVALSIKAEVVRSVPGADIALLQLEETPPGLTVATLGDSDTLRVGAPIFIVGAPLGITQTLTVGNISARRRAQALENGVSFAELFQTDAAINQGNSGGPMFNLQGEVVGIVSHMISQSGSYEGLGFAVTSNAASDLLMSPGTAWTGVRSILLEGPLARIFNLPQPAGLLIERVAKDSPADKLGIEGGDITARFGALELVIGGDILLEVLGVPVEGTASIPTIREQIAALQPGAPFVVKLLRAGEVITLSRPYQASSEPAVNKR